MTSLPLLNLPPNLPAGFSNIRIVDLRAELPVNPKYTWESLKGNRSLQAITSVVCHHDAYPKSVSAKWDDFKLAREIAGDHIRTTRNIPGGDPGFPYDAWIRNGTIYICNDLLPLKFGVASNNTYTVHICVSGDYKNHDTLSEIDRNALYAAIFLYKSQMPKFKQICGHGELSPSSCPGYNMAQVKTEVKQIEKAAALGGELDTTPNANMTRVFAAYTRGMDLYKVASTPGPNQAEGQRKWLQIADMMIDAGILKQ